ncbi:MAG: pyruvate:ferredoxin (flavodoxin) oxidoreductase [Oligoflexia bacterium]|nr:pyruvate:ferredoxin (flavodoxin) oxidoreductase [Oligoflexia bacterium]
MRTQSIATWDANEAVADIAFRTNEVIAIYPITPATPMGEHADAWSAHGDRNLWGQVPQVMEMQSEGGAAGTLHGSLQAGALTTTFTASQGLLLMIPNLYKIAGELTSAVIHVASRSIATHALSIFGDHSDVYAARATGFAMLASGSVQEAHDLALVAHSATLRCRVPFLHFFDGFRTSHEVSKTRRILDDDVRALIDDDAVLAHRERALTPDAPKLRGTAQNPDVFFQAREAINPFYDACPAAVQHAMDQLADRTGRSYKLFDYIGHPQATRVIVMMGSGAETAHETVEWMLSRGERVGLVKVRLYRPFSIQHLLEALPASTQVIAVLDRTKEPGATGEPLYLDVVAALHEARMAGSHPAADAPVVGGRYGLSSKEFTPAMVVGIFDALSATPLKNHFTVGIVDDVSHSSLPWDASLSIEPEDVVRAVFFGLGSDGTVGANKNSIKIIGEHTDGHVQGYFVYDSKKSGARTVSHLRFGPRPIRSAYLVNQASFVGCHQWSFLDRYDMLASAAQGAVFLLNSPVPVDQVWQRLPRQVQEAIIEKGLKVYTIDAYRVARDAGMPGRINTVMQTCFFAISGVLPAADAIRHIKTAIRKSYGSKGEEVVRMNEKVVDEALGHLTELPIPDQATATRRRPPAVSSAAPDFVQRVTGVMLSGQGDLLPVSAFTPDGTWPTATTRWEKRGIAELVPLWDPEVCIQCNKCALVCPHAAIRAKVYSPQALDTAPAGFRSSTWKSPPLKGSAYTIQLAPEDCTGCSLCAVVCPAKDRSNPRHKALDMVPVHGRIDAERDAFDFFLKLPEVDRQRLGNSVRDTQLRQPLFEFSGACAGCGETPYIKLLTQLFGDRLLVANATGCSSIYGGNLPTTPYAKNADGRGPAWSNSLFEDNAEFGLGFRLAVDQLADRARGLARGMAEQLGEALVTAAIKAPDLTEADIVAQRERVVALRARMETLPDSPDLRHLRHVVDYLVRKSVWLVGGDGWAYDIGYGGLDHVLASGRDVNVLVLDTQVYSNTGGQASKATPMAAVAKFAAGGRDTPKKDLGMLAMAYGHVYVAQVAFGAKDTQTVKAIVEAESFRGPSLIIAYSPCIAHGYNMARSLEQQKKATSTGFWPLYRHDPRRVAQGLAPMVLDSRPPTTPLKDFAYSEARYHMLLKANPQRAKELMTRAQAQVRQRFAAYEALARPPKDPTT